MRLLYEDKEIIREREYRAGEGITLEAGKISVQTPVKALAKAEYDALSEAEKGNALYLVDEPPWTPVPLSVQEYDTEDGWHVRKWSDGYVEMTLEWSTSVSEWAGWIGGYFATVTSSRTYPIALTRVYKANASVIHYDFNTLVSLFRGMSDNAQSETGIYHVFSASNVAQNFTFAYEVSGRWK